MFISMNAESEGAQVAALDALRAELEAKGVPVKDGSWGYRLLVIDDPDGKMRALHCFRSQFLDGRPAAPPTFLDDVRDRARYWGWSIGAGYGEPFVCREELGLRGLRDLA